MSQKLRVFVRLAALAVAGAGCLMVTACGPGSSGAASGASRASASASSTPDPLASVSANAIVTEAFADLKAASSLTMDGNLVVAGQPYALNLGIKSGKGCDGSIGMGSKGSFELIVIGKTIYLKPDDAFWKANAGSDAESVIQLVNGRYIKTTTSSSMGSVTQLCDLAKLVGSLQGSVSGPIAKGKLTTLDGSKVLPLTRSGAGTLWVTDTAKPEVVEIESPTGAGGPSGTSGTVTFSPGAPITLTAPPASEVLAGSAVGL